MKSKRFVSVITCLIMAFLMLFSTGCFDNPDRDSVYDDTTINQDDTGNNDNQNNNNDNNGDNNQNGDNGNTNKDSDDNNNGNDDNNNENNNENNNNNENGNESNSENNQEQDNVVNIVGFGDSIAAGYAFEGSDMYSSYVAYSTGEVAINDMCFTNVIAEKYAESYDEVNVKSYAQSGDKTNDLISKFNDLSSYPNLAQDVEDADIITLCIGANNVLSVALNNMANYFSGSISISEIETLLQQGVANFKNDYSNTIIPYLTQGAATVYVMTIYDPYYYFEVDDIEFVSANSYLVPFAKSYMAGMFNELKTLAIEYLDEVNNYIKSQNFENVIIIDINENFKALSKTEYSQVVNADSTKISINLDEVIDIYTLSIKDTSSLMNNPYFDPHPTALGQRYIANLFLRAMEMDEVALS